MYRRNVYIPYPRLAPISEDHVVHKPHITVEDARRIRNTRRQGFNRTKESLVFMLEKKIRTAATLGECDTLWWIPSSLCDVPSYDVMDMTEEIAQHFTTAGYYVKCVKNMIYLSWR